MAAVTTFRCPDCGKKSTIKHGDRVPGKPAKITWNIKDPHVNLYRTKSGAVAQLTTKPIFSPCGAKHG